MDRLVDVMCNPSFHVEDDFYDSPDDILDFAKGLSFSRTLLSATDSFVTSERAPSTKETLNRIARLVEVIPDWHQIDRIHNFWGFSSCGEFQLRTNTHVSEGRKHFHRKGQWTGLVYLSKTIPRGSYGTAFYRHKQTQTCHLSEIDDLVYSKLQRDNALNDRWERLPSPNMRFNRLVVFDSRYFHAEPPGFGFDAGTGRLVQIFNFTSTSFWRRITL